MKQNTKVLEEAYKKIIADKELQKKFLEAIKEKKLEKFLKDQKIEATVEEVKKYVIETFTSKDGELSKAELDLAAGGNKNEELKKIPQASIVIPYAICNQSGFAEDQSECPNSGPLLNYDDDDFC